MNPSLWMCSVVSGPRDSPARNSGLPSSQAWVPACPPFAKQLLARRLHTRFREALMPIRTSSDRAWKASRSRNGIEATLRIGEAQVARRGVRLEAAMLVADPPSARNCRNRTAAA